MFSPHYAAARRGGRAADPLNHVAVNVLLSGPGGRWAMTERGSGALERDAATISIGRSRWAWGDDALRLRIDERAAPVPRRVRGEVRVMPRALTGAGMALDRDARHRWRPMAPHCRVEVAFEAPSLRWSGGGYLDSNDGDGPLEADFHRWDWCRLLDDHGRVSILYDVFARREPARALALRLGADGRLAPFDPPPRQTLPPGLWRLPRFTRAEPGSARVRRTLLDAPFYVRSELDAVVDGAAARGIGESIDFDRFAHPVVRAMLHARAPRAGVRRKERP